MAPDPYKYFRTEAREIVDQLGKEILELEKGPHAPERVAKLLRLAHTLKGAARVVKQAPIANLAHAMEDTLAPLRIDGASASRELVEKLLACVDAMNAQIAALDAPPEAPRTETRSHPGPAPAEPLRTLRAEVEEVDALLDGLAEVGAELSGARRQTGGFQAVRQRLDLLGEGASARGRAAADDVRTALRSLERDLLVGLERTDRELRQARAIAERLRLVPAAVLFHALERAARDAAADLGKTIVFEARGGEVRLDADVLAAVQGALAHAVRNAVAHGLEAPAERRAAARGAEGRLAVAVARRGGRAAVVCRDDGRGIDFAAVSRAAERAGKLANPRAASTDDLVRLLLTGGVSTSATVTEVAGRGVGLDAVREPAARLGGDESLRTEAGHGTTLEMSVPLSLSALDALLVETGGQIAAIPLDTVRATLRLVPRDLTRTADGESILWNGSTVPFAPLARMLRAETRAEARAWSAMIVEVGGRSPRSASIAW